MRKTMSRYQLAANRQNGHLSTGPKTANGKATSKLNALKHGLRAREVVLRGRCIRESPREFAALHQRLLDDRNPIGLQEEMLVEQMATTYWRLRRVIKAESGEITLSVDNSEWRRKNPDDSMIAMRWGFAVDPTIKMGESAFGNKFLYHQWEGVRASVEKEGQLTGDAVKSVMFSGKPDSLTRELEQLRMKLQLNPEGLEETAFRAKQKEKALVYINEKMHHICWEIGRWEKKEDMEEQARQAADVLPRAETLEKLRRYEISLNKQWYRAMHELERLQRRRLGEHVPAPQVVEISNGS